MDEIIHHLAIFISRLWQIHVFGEGNTRTAAVFFIKYLRALDFDVTNDIFAENAWYFRNSLVRANYNDLKDGIYETTEYLEIFLRNLLLDGSYPLHNRMLHISGTFIDTESVNIDVEREDIDAEKMDVGVGKVNIEDVFTPKASTHIRESWEALGFQTAFGRSDIQRILGLKSAGSSVLLREMTEHGIIELVSGYGKGKYRLRQ